MARDKVSSGDPIRPRAALWNDMVDAARAHKARRLTTGRGNVFAAIPRDRVWVKNVAGEDLLIGSVVEIGDYAFDDDQLGQDQFYFECDKPSDAGAVHAILRQPIPDGEVGEAQLIGVVAAKVNVNDANHKYAKVVATQNELDSTDEPGPIRILHAPGTGSQLCAVLIDRSGDTKAWLGKPDSGIAAGSKGTVSIWDGTAGSETDSGENLTDCQNHANEEAESGVFVIVVEAHGERYIIRLKDVKDTTVLIEFTLTQAMGQTVANTATATITGSSDSGLEIPSATVVHDPQARWPDAIAGCKGTAWHDGDNFRVLSCTRAIREATATLNDAMCGDAPSVTGWTPRPIGEHQVDPGEGTLTNPRGHHGLDGDAVLFLRTNNAPPFTWAVVDVEKHVHKIIVPGTLRIKEGNTAIEAKVVEIAVETCQEPEDYEYEDLLPLYPNVFVGGVVNECGETERRLVQNYSRTYGLVETDEPAPASAVVWNWTAATVVVSNSYADGSWYYTPRVIYVPCALDPGSPVDYVTGEECEEEPEE